MNDTSDIGPDRADAADPPRRRHSDLRMTVLVFVTAAVLALGIAMVFHARAWSLYSQAGDSSLALDARVDAARQAERLEPFQRDFRVRLGYLYAQRLARDGHLLKAVDVMAATYSEAVGNAEMLAFFTRIQDQLALDTNRKAHLQHGHEGPGGTLRPQDIER